MEKENIFFAEEKKIGEGKEGKYLEKENVFFLEGEENSEGEGGSFAGGHSNRRNICKRPVHPDDHLQEAGTG